MDQTQSYPRLASLAGTFLQVAVVTGCALVHISLTDGNVECVKQVHLILVNEYSGICSEIDGIVVDNTYLSFNSVASEGRDTMVTGTTKNRPATISPQPGFLNSTFIVDRKKKLISLANTRTKQALVSLHRNIDAQSRTDHFRWDKRVETVNTWNGFDNL